MIEGLEEVLRDSRSPGLPELRRVLGDVLDGSGAAGRCTGEEVLKRGKVHRLAFEVDGRPRNVVIKCLDLPRAQRNELVATQWLPSAGLDDRAPALLGVAADRKAQAVWHVYEDLGDGTLDARDPDWNRVQAAIDVIAELHGRFAEHLLLPQVRMHGDDLGMTFYLANLRDAVRSLEALRPPAVQVGPEQVALRNRLLDRLTVLLDEGADRAHLLAEAGGPETLLHGDLWPQNILAVATADGLRTCLVDWDHAGVGPVTYDLSTLVYRFPVHQRPWIVDRYREAVEPLGWCLPDAGDLSLLLETAEISRIANCLIWPCLEAAQTQAGWAFDALADVETWFELVEPALPVR